MQKKHSVLIVDDHKFLITGVSQLLSATSLYDVVEEHVCDGLQVYSVCGRIQPDIVVLDLGLPGMDGIDVIHQLKRRWPKIIVIVLTADTTEYRAIEARRAGASGYVLKKSPQHILLSALQKAVVGQVLIDPSLNQSQVEGADLFLADSRSLTTRERQTLKLISEGNRNRDISEKLYISIKTVETHRLNLMRKLNAHCVADLVNWATRLGLSSN
ncbi:two component system response regulator [Pseudomonas chlororaphis subsp. aurantiaca]|nr:two component system response regulator [Pseudomonas chlororaphis subsp. aurantiaca]